MSESLHRFIRILALFTEEEGTWRSYSFLWKDIPLDNGQWKEGILIGILASMKLKEWQYILISYECGAGCNREGARLRGHLLFYTRDGPEFVSLQVSASPTRATID